MANSDVMKPTTKSRTKTALKSTKPVATASKGSKSSLQASSKAGVKSTENVQGKSTISRKPKRSKRKKRSGFITFVRVGMLGAVAIFVWCMYCYFLLSQYTFVEPVKKADAGIVLGAALWNNVPSPALKERLDRAYELYEEGLIEYIIASGGQPDYVGSLPEAEGMRDYLIKRGIPSSQIIMEPNSHDTYQNLLFSSIKAKENNIDSVIIVTHSYHGLRAQEIAHYLDYKDVQVSGVQSKVLNASYHNTREILAYTKWKINSVLLRLGLSI